MLLEFPQPDRCIVGTVGEPGNRLFVIQVSQGNDLASVAVEKQQVQVLAKRIISIVEQLADLGQAVILDTEPRDMGPLDAPLNIEFSVGAIGLAWDADRRMMQLEFISSELGERDDDEGNVLLQIWLSPERALEFARRGELIVARGRPSCPFCTQPINPGGHICPRANGFRGPLF